MIKKLVLKNRSCRRFHQKKKIKRKTLRELIDLARITPSAGNRQPLKYIISNNKKKNKLIFPHLNWAGALKDWDGPEPGERPPAYIIVLGDTTITNDFSADPGIAMQTILLAAVEKKLNGCIFGAVNRRDLRQDLNISSRYDILYVIALGKGREKIELEVMKNKDEIDYWRDDNDVHHVPKRPLDNIILEE